MGILRSSGSRAACALLVLLLGCAAASAETVFVTNSADSGVGSLRAAISAANASTTATTIQFAAGTDGSPIVLASALPDWQGAGEALTITGNGPGTTVIDGASLYRPFKAGNGVMHITLQQLTVRNGFADQGQGGAVYFYPAPGSSLTIDAVVFDANRSTFGGGAIYSARSTTIRNSLFRANNAGTDGGANGYPGAAFVADGGDWLVSNSTFVDNDARTATILHFSTSTQARLVHITATGNNANAGTIYANLGVVVSISNSLVVANSDFAVATAPSGTIDLATSFHNVFREVEPDVMFQDGVNGNQLGVSEPLIGLLGDYGGPSPTIPLLPGSPAIDAGTTTGSDIPTHDQRGKVRVGMLDVGAFESQGFAITVAGGNNQQTPVDRAFPQPLEAAVSANDPIEPVAGGKVHFSAPTSGASAVFASAKATISAAGIAQTLAYANAVVGGPYAVSAGLPSATSVTFSLANLTGSCVGYAYPYSLSASGNTALVAELRQAVDCANTNGLDDSIDLGGHTLLFSDGPYTHAAQPHGDNALPVVRANLSLENGNLQRDPAAAAFRFIEQVGAEVALDLRDISFLHGQASDAGGSGGAIRVEGGLRVVGSTFQANQASIGGAIFSSGAQQQPLSVVTSNFHANTGEHGAAISAMRSLQILNSHFTANGDASALSVVSGGGFLVVVNSLFAHNVAGASDGALIALASNANLIGMRNVTVVDNQVGGPLFALADSQAYASAYNSIVWGNQCASLNASAGYSIWQGASQPGSSNLHLPPGFVDAASGDYRLASGSPAVDAANNSYSYQDALDLDGDGDVDELAPDLNLNPRLMDDASVVDTGASSNGDPIIDMGAFERQADSAAAGITLTPSAGLVTTEDGGTASFHVKLQRYPGAEVRLAFTSSNLAEGVVAPGDVTLSPADWNQPHLVTITGVADGVLDGDVAYQIITSVASSSDPAYAGMNPADVAVTNHDVPPEHNVGGSVTGLVGGGLVLSLNGGSQSLAINGNGLFEFASPLDEGSSYAVSVATQPASPLQHCVVLNGNGTVAESDVTNVIVNCGSANTYSVGGLLGGLDNGKTVTLQLNGGGDLILPANGSYAFAPQLVDGASYVVTVKSQPQGQLCSLVNATGIISGGNVDNVDVDCDPLQAELHLSVDDGHGFARYGQVRDYFVTLSNTGNTAATDVAIGGVLSAAFDQPNVQWQCIAGGGGAICTAQGNGGFFDVATIPAHSSLLWVVSVPVLLGSSESHATFAVSLSAPGLRNGVPPEDSDTDTLVIFRDGFNVAYADGTEAMAIPGQKPAPLQAASERLLVVPPARADGIVPLHVFDVSGQHFEVQRLGLAGRNFVRLLARDDNGRERASRWAGAPTATPLALGSVAGDDGLHLILLEGASQSLILPANEPDSGARADESTRYSSRGNQDEL